MAGNQTNNTSSRGELIWGRVLSGILLLAVLGTIAVLIYSVATPFKEPFTEFYLLDLNGRAAEYTRGLKAGEEAQVVVGIVNHEYETTTYRVEINLEGTTYREIREIVLEHQEKFEEAVSFTPDKTGDNQKLEFLLFRDENVEVYQSVFLLIDVR